MSQCQGITKAGKPCTRQARELTTLCWQHSQSGVSPVQVAHPPVAGKRIIGNTQLVNTYDQQQWEAEYEKIMDKKYAKGTRKYNLEITGKVWTGQGNPPIFLVPRTRGGPSYKAMPLWGTTSEDVHYMAISKGYAGQDVSSFTLGPIVGEGLNLVNAAFSKSICIMHIEGGGTLDLKRKNFWHPSKAPTRNVKLLNETTIIVDGQGHNIFQWLKMNENLWLPEWEKWRRAIAMSSLGDFHWTDKSPTIAYQHRGEYLDFVTWKKECYIKPSYQLLPQISVFQHLQKVWTTDRRPLALVHPKSHDSDVCYPITVEEISQLFNSPTEMCCQPYVVAGKLLGVPV